MEKENSNENTPSVEKEALTDKGQERFEQLAESITKAKDRLSSWTKTGFSKIGRFFKSGAVGVLSAPEAVGYAKDQVKEKTVEGAQFVAEKYTQGVEYVDGKITKGADYVNDKITQFEDWTGDKAVKAYQFSAEKASQTKEFISNKSGQVAEFAKDKALFVEAVSGLVKDKTVEKLNIAKEATVDRFDKVVDYGKNSIDSAKMLAHNAKESFVNKKNAMMRSILERKAEIQMAKLEKIKAKLAQYDTVENLEAQMAA